MHTKSKIISFLEEYPPICEKKGICTTCGGQLLFLGNLKRTFPDDNEIFNQLIDITGSDVWNLHNKGNCILSILNYLPEEKKGLLINNWFGKIETDPDLALAILLWIKSWKEISENKIFQLLVASEPLLLRIRKYRDDIRKSNISITRLPSRVLEAIEKDKKEDKQEYERKRQTEILERNVRNDYLNCLSQFSIEKRVPIILSDLSIKQQEWRENWDDCSIENLESLSKNDVQELIDICESSYPYRWTKVLKNLYDTRHNNRIKKMDEFRSKYASLKPEDQLLHLLNEKTISIEEFPIELSELVTNEFINKLDKDSRSHLLKLLQNTRLKKWRRVLNNTAIN